MHLISGRATEVYQEIVVAFANSYNILFTMMNMQAIEDSLDQMIQSSSESNASQANEKKLSVPSKSVRSKKKEEHKKHLNQKFIINRCKPRGTD